jgi:hypothetical protein
MFEKERKSFDPELQFEVKNAAGKSFTKLRAIHNRRQIYLLLCNFISRN